MKKSILLSMFFLLSFTLMAQPLLPMGKQVKPEKVKTVKEKAIITDNYVAISVNYGFAEILDLNLFNVKDKAILGVGYSTYIGNDVKGDNLGYGNYTYKNSYQTKDKAYYLILGRQFSRLAATLKLGLLSDAVYNNYTDGINPNSVFYSKVGTNEKFLYGASLNYLLNQTTGVTLAYDNSNEYTVGVSTKLW